MPGPFYFAWAGAAIQPQVTVVTNGTTHGGILQSVTIVGDIGGAQGDQQIRNIASNSDLEVGTLYRVTGPGIADGTIFLYDTTGLAPDDTVNVNTVTATLNSVTLTLTKSIVVGDFVGTFTAGSNIVLLGSIDLPAGDYAISSPAIGQTLTPVTTQTGTIVTGGTGYTDVPSALFYYDGASGASDMKIMAATEHVSIGGPFGGATITYTVAFQEVIANASGEFPVQIMGLPDADWYSVTAIPTGALVDVTPGLRYNIAGNGIQNGTTFLGPARGATAIELDLPASTSQINAILTITGPRTPGAPFDPTIHNRFDEQVLGFELSQEEGNFATLNIDLLNPAIGLLGVGRNLWCWLSYDQAWLPDGSNTPDLIPLYTGRLVGVPKLQANEIVKLEFLARPDDFNTQKVALTQAMSVLPFYDPVWLATNVNPDTVLEAYSQLFHIDRTSLAVTASDILQGEDGTLTIGEDQAFYDNFSLAYGEPPITELSLSGTVTWTQEADGLVDVTGKLFHAFGNAGSTPLGVVGGSSVTGIGYGWGLTTGFGTTAVQIPGGQLISILNGDGLYGDWPKPGSNIGGGWALSNDIDGEGVPLCFIQDANKPLGWLTQLYYNVDVTGNDPTGAQTNNFALAATSSIFKYQYTWKLNSYMMRMVLRYKAARKRTETVSAVMIADVQRELSDTSESDRETVDLTSEFVGQGVDPGGGIPLGNLSRRTYFQTDRGAASFEYLLLLGRAKIRARARAADITFAVDFPTALGITLRNSVTLFDRRLPGGSATGKVKSYRITVGEGGQTGEFTIGCSIGNGNPSSPAVGTNSYVEDGYVDAGYQVVAAGQYAFLTDELAYETLDNFVVADDGVTFPVMDADSVVNSCIVTNGLTQQIDLLSPYKGLYLNAASIQADPNSVLATLKTTVTLDLKPVAGAEFHTNYFPAVSMLALPKTLDLAAATGPSSWDVPIGGAVWDSGTSSWDTPA